MLSSLLAFFKPKNKNPTDLVTQIKYILLSLRYDNQTLSTQYKYDISKNLSKIKSLISSKGKETEDFSGGSPIACSSDLFGQLSCEFCSHNLLELLIKYLHLFEFEAKKDVVTIFTVILNRKIGMRTPTVDHIISNPNIVILLFRGYCNPEIALFCGIMIRECTKHEQLVQLILQLQMEFPPFIDGNNSNTGNNNNGNNSNSNNNNNDNDSKVNRDGAGNNSTGSMSNNSNKNGKDNRNDSEDISSNSHNGNVSISNGSTTITESTIKINTNSSNNNNNSGNGSNVNGDNGDKNQNGENKLPCYARLFEMIKMTTFDISSDAFATLRDLLTKHPLLISSYLRENHAMLFGHLNEILKSENYAAKRQTLKLLGDILAMKTNDESLHVYTINSDNLKLIMTLMLNKSRNIQAEAFSIFKLFISNPKKTRLVHEILVKNKEKLEMFVANLSIGREDEKLDMDKMYVLHCLDNLTNDSEEEMIGTRGEGEIGLPA